SPDPPKVKVLAANNRRNSRQSILEKAVFRPRQAEILAQRPSLILVAENAAPLQFRYYLVDEVVEAGGQEREHDVEAVAAVARQPLLHLVGDPGGRAHKRQAAIAADPLGELAHGELVAGGDIDQALTAAFRGIGFGDVGQLAVRIETGRIGPQDHRQRGDGAVVVHPAVKQRALFSRLLDAVADHDKGAGQDLEVIAVAAELVHAALDVGIELLPVRQAAAAGEHGFR